jgi:hypothetical protein
MITLVVITVVVVALWAMAGGLDQIQVGEAEPTVVSD